MIVGIDVSTYFIDYVKVDEDDPLQTPEWKRVELYGRDSWERSLSIVDLAPNWDDDWWRNVSAIGIEEPYGRWVVGKLYRVQGIVIGRLPRVKIERWMPGRWRKQNGMKGNATKEDVYTFVLGLLPDDAAYWTQDAADAFCVARAMQLWEKGRP